jgi:hypothetical protein
MKDTITHFMWGYQPHFRRSVEQTAEIALREIGAGVGPRCYLVGFGIERSAQWPVCIEPETEPIADTDLGSVSSRADTLYESHEDFRTFDSDPRVDELRHAWLKNQSHAAALCEVLSSSAAGQGRTFFASPAKRVGDYDVHVVISVIADRWAELPSLHTNRRQRMDLQTSLQEAVVCAILAAATRALDRKEPPQSLSIETLGDHHNLIRLAADHFMYSVGIMSGQLFASGLHAALDAVAAQPYEGRTGVGKIVLTAQTSNYVQTTVELTKTVQIDHTRAFRKVLEMSGADLHVLCNGLVVYGLGHLTDTYPSSAEEAFELRVVGRGSWELAHADTPLLRVDNTRPTLPRRPVSEHHFSDTVRRVFSETKLADIAALWSLAEGAAKQEHGTMLVVHRDAENEAARLEPQALRIAPAALSEEVLRAVTNIDGAVLVSPDGRCHAVGVILDGRATGTGDPARGARYNSAVRYSEAANGDCLVIIVSEDGMINLLPDLRRRIQRSELERALADHEAASQGEVDFEQFYRRDDHIVALRFYLNADQCRQVNAARSRVEDYRWSISEMRIERDEFTPDPGMNDSYFF